MVKTWECSAAAAKRIKFAAAPSPHDKNKIQKTMWRHHTRISSSPAAIQTAQSLPLPARLQPEPQGLQAPGPTFIANFPAHSLSAPMKAAYRPGEAAEM